MGISQLQTRPAGIRQANSIYSMWSFYKKIKRKKNYCLPYNKLVIMRIPAFFILIGLLTACSRPESLMAKQLDGSDSLIIRFNAPQTDSIVKTLTTTDKNAINKLTGFINNKPADLVKCGYDGNLLFYKKEKLAGDVSFNYAVVGCQHFIYAVKNDSLSVVKMSNEAVNLLKSLAEGKEGY